MPTLRNDTLPAEVRHWDSLPDSAIARHRVASAVTGLSRATLYRLAAAGTIELVQMTPKASGFRVGSLRRIMAGKR